MCGLNIRREMTDVELCINLVNRPGFRRRSMIASGRCLSVVTTACAGQVECKSLVSWNATDWSVVVQMGGQVSAISQGHHNLR